jgi:hypothetical protein
MHPAATHYWQRRNEIMLALNDVWNCCLLPWARDSSAGDSCQAHDHSWRLLSGPRSSRLEKLPSNGDKSHCSGMLGMLRGVGRSGSEGRSWYVAGICSFGQVSRATGLQLGPQHELRFSHRVEESNVRRISQQLPGRIVVRCS